MLSKAVTRRAVLLAFGAVMGKFNVLKVKPVRAQASRADLSVNLDQWRAVVFQHKGKTVVVPVADVFDALVTDQKETV